MKISFLCPTVSRTSGGIFEIERSLAQGLARLPGTELQIFGHSDEFSVQDSPSWHPLQPRHFAYAGPSSFRYSSRLRRAFLAVDADLAHLHALWTHNSIVMREWSQRWKRPYLITANGMLDPWAIRNSGWKKKIALSLYERGCLEGAACIQVNSKAEYKSVRSFDLKNPICIIPNGIDLPEEDDHENSELSLSWENGKKVLLYLGRLHPKKGLANLLRAWAQISRSRSAQLEWMLAIAGWDEGGHRKALEKLASELGILSSVNFLGPRYGLAKARAYRSCDAFVLPSFSEGLPMVILEAWSYRKPVIMTAECNLPEGFAAGAGLAIEPSVQSIAEGLKRLFSMSDKTRHSMGENGFALVERNFTWSKVANQMLSVYQWILGSLPKPACVLN